MGLWEMEEDEELGVKKKDVVEKRRIRERRREERYALSLLDVNGVKNIGGILQVFLKYTHRHFALLQVSQEGT